MTASAGGGTLGRWLAIAASVVVLGTIVASVIVTGTPSEQREIRLDARRVDNLQSLESEIQRHFEQEAVLPASLAVLAGKPGVSLAIVDPVTGTPYEYERTGERAYRLCATFTTDTAQTRATADDRASGSEWAHGSGRGCFERTAKNPVK